VGVPGRLCEDCRSVYAKGGNVDVAVVDCSNNTLTGEAVTYEFITTSAAIDTTHAGFNPSNGTIRLTNALDTTGVAAGFGCALVISDTNASPGLPRSGAHRHLRQPWLREPLWGRPRVSCWRRYGAPVGHHDAGCRLNDGRRRGSDA
jgi:hypothetical protein